METHRKGSVEDHFQGAWLGKRDDGWRPLAVSSEWRETMLVKCGQEGGDIKGLILKKWNGRKLSNSPLDDPTDRWKGLRFRSQTRDKDKDVGAMSTDGLWSHWVGEGRPLTQQSSIYLAMQLRYTYISTYIWVCVVWGRTRKLGLLTGQVQFWKSECHAFSVFFFP